MTTKDYQEKLSIEELQVYKTYTAKQVAILVGIYVLLSLIPIFDQLEIPLRFTLTDLIIAIVLIILIEILCDFGEKNEQYQFITIHSTYQSGTIIKYLIYVISAIIGYAAYKDIVTPYLGEYSWIYPAVLGLIIISILFVMARKITQTSEQKGLKEQEYSSSIIEPTEEQKPEKQHPEEQKSEVQKTEEQGPQNLEETVSDLYKSNNLEEQQELPELLEDPVEDYDFQGEVTLGYIMEIFQDHEQEQEQEQEHEHEAEVEHEAEPEAEHEPEDRKVDVKKQDDITDKEEYSHESETTGIKCKNCGATIKYGTIFCNNCFGS